MVPNVPCYVYIDDGITGILFRSKNSEMFSTPELVW